MPPELADEAALLSYLGLSPGELKKIWWYRQRMYHQFSVPKGGSKVRVITAPNERLKYLQRKIAPLLGQLYRVRHPVHGFVRDKSVRTNASAHLGRRFVLNLDLKDFFPSITEKRIVGVLESLDIDGRVAAVIARICCNDNHLPQGAPTSPILSNMICFRLDKELLNFSKGMRCIYTRYADDITFSSHQPMTTFFEGPAPSAGRFSPDSLAQTLRYVLLDNGFTINPDKAHYADRHSRRMVTGLKVNEILNVDRRYVRNVRAALHSVETLGAKTAEEKFKGVHGGKCDLSSHLKGKINWLRHIRGHSDPVFRSIALRFNTSFPHLAITVAPTPAEARERAVWVIEDDDKQGSAFFLEGVGLVTAAHCVEGSGKFEIYHPAKPSNKFPVAVIKRHAVRDLAILGHTIPPTEYFNLQKSSRAVAVGDSLTAIGYPGFGPGDKLNVREGKVTSLPTKHGVNRIEVAQKLSQGMSGGPLLNNDNEVVGIVHKGGSGEERDFATNIDALVAWLAE